jgi:hypothetical protein
VILKWESLVTDAMRGMHITSGMIAQMTKTRISSRFWLVIFIKDWWAIFLCAIYALE